MTIDEARKQRIEVVRRFRASSADLNNPKLFGWAQSRLALADKIEAMSDAELLDYIAAERHMSDKMTSGV